MSFKKLILGVALLGALFNGACGRDNNHTNPTNVISYSVPEETSNNYKVGAEIEDGDGIVNADIRFYDSNNNEIGYLPMNRISGDSVRGIYETPSFPNLDGGKLIFEVSVVEGAGASLRLKKQNYKVYLSNQHGKEAILNAYNSHIFDVNSPPTGIRQDITTDVVNSTYIEADVAVDFNHSLIYNGISSNSAIIYFNYLAKNNDNSIDPQGDKNILDNELYNSPITIGIPNRYIPYDNLGTPTTRADIEGIIESILIYEDMKIIY